jgi:hypothetical protein
MVDRAVTGLRRAGEPKIRQVPLELTMAGACGGTPICAMTFASALLSCFPRGRLAVGENGPFLLQSHIWPFAFFSGENGGGFSGAVARRW